MWYRNLFNRLHPGQSQTPELARCAGLRQRPAPCRLAVEALEDRCVPASLSISDVTVPEGVSGTRNAEVVVSLSAPSNKTVTVDYLTPSGRGSALAASDYDAVFGKLTFAPGDTSQSIFIPIHGDRQPELDETVQVWLEHPRHARISDGVGVVTILDSSPRITISESAWAWEADGFITFEVNLSAVYDLPVTVNFATQDTDGYLGYANAAVAGEDYVATSGTLTFAPGETTATITVLIIGDTTPEYDEVFLVGLSGASNALINGAWSEGLIFEGWGPQRV